MILLISILLAIPFVIWSIKSGKKDAPSIDDNSVIEIESFEEFEKDFFQDYKEEGEETLKVELTGNSFDISKIQSYEGEELKKFEFRPQTWDQFIGQTIAKNKIQTAIKKIKRGIKTHILVNGIKGHGKTTFIELFAKELNAKLIERIGKQVDEKNLPDIIQKEINESKKKYVIFFIDELDTIDCKVLKILNPIIESFKIGGKRIKPFIFCGATINKHILIKNNPDTLDRISTSIKFERYNSQEVAKIIKQYQLQLYTNDLTSQQTIKAISENCKFNPRTSIALLEDYIVDNNIDSVLKNSNIIKEGLTITDIRILEILNDTTRPIGANALSQRAGLSQEQYIREYEPYLCEYNYIERVPSRKISLKGKNILEDLKK